MSAAIGVSLFGIIVAAVVTLTVAAMNRKQMRQIELHRIDPTIPLVPPPHPITHLLKTYWWFLVIGGFNLAMLVRHMDQTTPVTRAAVLEIALGVTTIALMFSFAVAIFIMEKAFQTASKMIGMLGMTRDISGKITDKTKQIEERRE